MNECCTHQIRPRINYTTVLRTLNSLDIKPHREQYYSPEFSKYDCHIENTSNKTSCTLSDSTIHFCPPIESQYNRFRMT